MLIKTKNPEMELRLKATYQFIQCVDCRRHKKTNKWKYQEKTIKYKSLKLSHIFGMGIACQSGNK